MSFGHLPGAFLEIFFWFQKATFGAEHVLAYASFFSSLLQLLCVHGRPAGVLCCSMVCTGVPLCVHGRPAGQNENTH